MTFTFILLFSNYGHLHAPVIYTVTVNISKSSEIIYSWKNQMISTANKIHCLKKFFNIHLHLVPAYP